MREEGALPPAGVAWLVLNPPHVRPPCPRPVLVIPQPSGPWDCGGPGPPRSLPTEAKYHPPQPTLHFYRAPGATWWSPQTSVRRPDQSHCTWNTQLKTIPDPQTQVLLVV